MKNKITSTIVVWLSLALNLAQAQTSTKLSGKVSDLNERPLEGATVRLFKYSGSVAWRSTLTDSSGKFEIIVDNGVYKLSVNVVGYKQYVSTVKIELNMLTSVIRLSPIESSLGEIKITGQKALVEHKIDRTVINVDANIGNAGSNIMEVLEKSPGVAVDQSGAIILKSKGATIFIDGKPSYLSGADLTAYLTSLPASSVDQIELMTNPPAKYDAAGNGGVINIITKKGKAKGAYGGVNLSYIQGRYVRTNNSFNFNYRNNKVNLFANLSYSSTNFYSDMDFYRHYVDANGDIISNFLQNSYTRSKSQSARGIVGIDYYISENSTIGINSSGIFRPSSQIAPVTSVFTNAQNLHDSTVVAYNSDKGNFKNSGLNLNYRHQYGKSGRELTADLDYLHYRTIHDQTFINNSFQPDGKLTNTEVLKGNLPATIQIYSAKADYTHPLQNGFKFAAGVKTSYTNTDNDAVYFYTVDNSTSADYGKTNHFLYRENINAAYVNANKDFKRLSIQAGLRFENTLSTGHQLGNLQKRDSTFKRSYINLFPTFYLQYKLDSADTHQLGFNYGRRIERPYYQDLNPFLSPLDKFTYYTGNPFLKPSYTDGLELSYTYKNRITTSLSYSKAHDQVNETIEIVNGIYYSKPGNIGSSVVKSISVDGNFDPTKWLNFHFYGELTNIHTVSAFYTGPLNTRGTFFYIKPILQFKPGSDWVIQLDGYYQSKVTNVQFIAGLQKRINLAVSKKISSNTTVKLAVNDVFHSYVNSGIINNLALTRANYVNVGDTRTAILSFSYRFGKALTTQRSHEVSGADSEKNRVKN